MNRTYIDRFDATTEYSTNEQRISKTSLSITLYGYIIPETINKELRILSKEIFMEEEDLALDILEEELVLEELSASPRFYGPDYED